MHLLLILCSPALHLGRGGGQVFLQMLCYMKGHINRILVAALHRAFEPQQCPLDVSILIQGSHEK